MSGNLLKRRFAALVSFNVIPIHLHTQTRSLWHGHVAFLVILGRPWGSSQAKTVRRAGLAGLTAHSSAGS